MIILPDNSPAAMVAGSDRQIAADAVTHILRVASWSWAPFEVHQWPLSGQGPRQALALDIVRRGCRHLVTLGDVQSAIETVEQVTALVCKGYLISWVHGDPISPRDLDRCLMIGARADLWFHPEVLPVRPTVLQIIPVVNHLLLSEHGKMIQQQTSDADRRDATNHPDED